MTELIKLDAYPIADVFHILLQDKSTKQNIIWATDHYESYGFGYRDVDQMKPEKFKGINAFKLQPRISKTLEEQQDRTRKKAEVMTPVWLCNKMNNFIDEEWFGRKKVFNVECGNDQWDVIDAKIEFSNEKKWKQYVDSRRIEITCGEAPYLVSRYDTTTGELILPPFRRIGLLDRKLRIVNENTLEKEDWIKWAIRAVQSCYGYEYQGDNLLIARINVLVTFCDYYEERWAERLDKRLLTKIANIISWNLWQMDGLTDRAPLGKPYEDNHQITIFETLEDDEPKEERESIPCRIYNWRSNESLEFRDIKKGYCNMSKKLFDFVIGNPPYQEDISTSEDNKALSKQIFPDFIKASVELSKIATELITPSRWFAGDAQDKSFLKLRKFFQENNHICKLVHFPNEKEVFENVVIKGGVSCFIYKPSYLGNVAFSTVVDGKETKVYRPLFEDGLDIVLSDEMQISILMKIKNKSKSYLTELTKGRNAFGIIGKECVIQEISEEKPFDNCCQLRIKGNAIRYITSDKVTKCNDVFDAYKIFVSKSAGAPGKDLKIIGSAYIGEPGVACSDSLIPIGCFDNLKEAQNLQKYMTTKFLRFMVSILKMSQNVTQIVYRYVPLQDFTDKSDINWNTSIKNIDKQLYKKYGLTEEEINFIETNIKEME